MRERNTNLCIFYIVEDRTAEQLLPIIQKHVNPGSLVMSDMWKAYNNVASLNVEHLTVNHSLHFVSLERDPKTPNMKIHTNGIESIWKDAKRLVHLIFKNDHNFTSMLSYNIRSVCFKIIS
jgi:hypothetical protein